MDCGVDVMRAIVRRWPCFFPPQRQGGMAHTQPLVAPARVCSLAGDVTVRPQRETVQLTCSALQGTLGTLLEDRQCLYRNTVLKEKFSSHRHELKSLLQNGTPVSDDGCVTSTGLTRARVLQWREKWVGEWGVEEETLLEFYNATLFCAATASDADIRLVLDVMQNHDHIAPNANTYVAIMLSLIAGCDHSNKTAGDAVFYYFGHAIKTRGESFVTEQMWGALFVACAVMEVVGKIVDQWWDLLVKTCDDFSSPLPYAAVHGALTWCSANRDVERVMRFFQTANSKGVVIRTDEGLQHVIKSGGLTEQSGEKIVQMCQLKLMVKLIVTVKSIKMDGGLRSLVIKDIRRLIERDLLRSAPWGVINDLLGGLSMPSAMQLLKFRSLADPEKDGAIPFTLWASLLRRCARDHHIDQAEAVFLFIRKRFQLTGEQKAELVEIMMRMFATLPQGDFASAMSLFLEHVLRHPSGEPPVRPNATMYNLLIRAGDTRNASMMTFLEACAAGVEVNEETFDVVMSSNRYATLASLSRKLPHDYHASKLDEQLHIPAQVDAHLRREEAQKFRGKELVDSTGEVN